ncbi:MAG: glycosyltransferase [Bacteroidota bacterium]
MAFIIIVSIYCAMILVLLVGFRRLREPQGPATIIHSISVVVPFRNEAQNLPALLRSLAEIKYPKWEIILVDDHSTDNYKLVSGGLNIRLIQSPGHGKKAAITTAVQNSASDIIVTTDADCLVGSRWLEKINLAFQDPKIQMMIGGVRIEENETFFSRLQALEFVSVAATGAGTLGLGFPTMCNGANLSYRRTAFMAVGGYQGNENISSGDDEALMNALKKTSKDSIAFLFSGDALVTTGPSATLKEFAGQRLRWAGKWQSNISIQTRLFAMVVWLFHLAFITMALSALAGFITWKLFIILASAKVFAEALLLIPAAKFFRVKWRWISFFALQFIYSFYVICTGFLSQILLSGWKGRAVVKKV